MTFAEIKPLLFPVLITVGIMIGIFFEERRHRRRNALLRDRPQISARDFGIKFYRDRQQAAIAARVRDMLATKVKISLDGLRPTDQLAEDLLIELPAYPDLFWDLEKEFGIQTEIDHIETDEQYQQLFKPLVTFHDLVCYVEGKLKLTKT